VACICELFLLFFREFGLFSTEFALCPYNSDERHGTVASYGICDVACEISDEQVKRYPLPHDAAQIRTRDGARRGKEHRLDPTHPCAPAPLGWQIGQIAVEPGQNGSTRRPCRPRQPARRDGRATGAAAPPPGSTQDADGPAPPLTETTHFQGLNRAQRCPTQARSVGSQYHQQG